MSDVVIIGGDLVRRLLPMEDCIEIMDRALAEFGRGSARQPVRESLRTEHGVLALMPAELVDSRALGYKAVTVFGSNAARGLPVHQALVALLDADTGRVEAIVDGTAVTTMRTAAVSAVATRALARPDSSSLAILGTGVQAVSHLEAIPLVRAISRVAVWGRSKDAAARVAEAARARGLEAIAADSAREALDGADVVVTATAAREPVLRHEWLAAGTHINAVGACFPDTREIDAATMAAADLYVDDRAAALVEAGDLLLAIADGAVGPDHIRGSLGEVLAGRLSPRWDPAGLTVFESLGIGLEDVAVAAEVADRARRTGAGVTVDL